MAGQVKNFAARCLQPSFAPAILGPIFTVDVVETGTGMGWYRAVGAGLLCIVGMLSPAALASEHLSDHEVVCLQQNDCLQYLQTELAKQPIKSTAWYKLQSYLLDFYFDKQRVTELRQLAEQLLQLEDNPQVLQAQLYFYYAKALLQQGERKLATDYANLAGNKISALFDGFGDPLRLVELANLQISLQQFDRAEQTLLLAEGRYGKSHDPIFIFELNTNKALLEDRRQQLAYAALYRQRALDAILPTGHSGKIVVALGNLARTQQLQGQYQPARLHYQQALPYLASGTDEITQAVYLLRLAELSWQLQDLAAGRQYFRQVQFATLPSENHRQLYQQLHQQFARI